MRRRTSRPAIRRSTPPSAAMAAPLGSLTQLGTTAGRACRACGSGRVTQIAMALTDGSRVEFVSCHRCEDRSWSEEGERLPIAHVLDKTRKLV